MQPQPQIYRWESALEYLVFHKGSYPSVKMSHAPNFGECPLHPGAGHSMARYPLNGILNTLNGVVDTHMQAARSQWRGSLHGAYLCVCSRPYFPCYSY
ncbi:hypothetical protein N7454_005571 [Penicillium verhagenii]|nr:hypothetical protein N7454_005571 [Penicillium verhagenii]